VKTKRFFFVPPEPFKSWSTATWDCDVARKLFVSKAMQRPERLRRLRNLSALEAPYFTIETFMSTRLVSVALTTMGIMISLTVVVAVVVTGGCVVGVGGCVAGGAVVGTCVVGGCVVGVGGCVVGGAVVGACVVRGCVVGVGGCVVEIDKSSNAKSLAQPLPVFATKRSMIDPAGRDTMACSHLSPLFPSISHKFDHVAPL